MLTPQRARRVLLVADDATAEQLRQAYLRRVHEVRGDAAQLGAVREAGKVLGVSGSVVRTTASAPPPQHQDAPRDPVADVQEAVKLGRGLFHALVDGFLGRR